MVKYRVWHDAMKGGDDYFREFKTIAAANQDILKSRYAQPTIYKVANNAQSEPRRRVKK